MRRIVYLLITLVLVAGIVAFTALASGDVDEEAAPLFGVRIPPGYRDWRLISVAHEEGNLNDLRAILSNEVAINTYREIIVEFDSCDIALAAHESEAYQKALEALASGAERDYRIVEGA